MVTFVSKGIKTRISVDLKEIVDKTIIVVEQRYRENKRKVIYLIEEDLMVMVLIGKVYNNQKDIFIFHLFYITLFCIHCFFIFFSLCKLYYLKLFLILLVSS